MVQKTLFIEFPGEYEYSFGLSTRDSILKRVSVLGDGLTLRELKIGMNKIFSSQGDLQLFMNPVWPLNQRLSISLVAAHAPQTIVVEVEIDQE